MDVFVLVFNNCTQKNNKSNLILYIPGTAGIILQAPSLYDDRKPIDKELSIIGIDQGKSENSRKDEVRRRVTC